MAKRIQSLQALRGIAFLLIFASHCTFVSGFASAWGAIGVSIFVVLQGFVVTFNQKFRQEKYTLKPLPYMLKRVNKIYPLHLLMLVVRVIYDYFFYGVVTTIPVILLNITMLKSFVPVKDIFYSMGGATWYLTLVCFFALLTPLLIKFLKVLIKQKKCLLVFCLLVVFRVTWIYAWHLDENSLWWNYVNPFFRVSDYFMGMILGANINQIEDIIESKKCYCWLLRIVVWVTFITYVISMSVTKLPWYNIYIRTPLSIGLIVLFMAVATMNKTERGIVYENRFLVYIGNISFELFLIHIHVRNILLYGFGDINAFVLLILVFGASVMLAQTYASFDSKVRIRLRERKREEYKK